ncbi:hypothetical protein Tco_0342505 [Tanacetum coccineum]
MAAAIKPTHHMVVFVQPTHLVGALDTTKRGLAAITENQTDPCRLFLKPNTLSGCYTRIKHPLRYETQPERTLAGYCYDGGDAVVGGGFERVALAMAGASGGE